VVVGAGVFGTWTAHHLRRAGADVTLVDAYGPGNSRSSSGDESRIIRCGYGADEIYSRFALRSLDLWAEFEASSPDAAAPLFHRCGVLWMETGDTEYLEATRRTLESGPYAVEILDPPALRARFPQLQADDAHMALLEPRCGVLMARRAVATLAVRLEREGVRVLRARASAVVAPTVRVREIALSPGLPERLNGVSPGRTLEADAFVFACGPWLPKVFPSLLAGRIRPTRQSVMYFGTPAGDDLFSPGRLPAWVSFRSGVYGAPDLEGRGLKLGIDTHGPPFDPDSDDRAVDQEAVAFARAWLRGRMPAMAEAPLVESRVCQYENTSTGDFLIDRHPDHDNVWIAGGGSGHGFKHGPAVGELVARMVLDGAPTEERFKLATKAATAARVVY
jgi:glycine/D-amino acid oxidase-like deaminating enzyme